VTRKRTWFESYEPEAILLLAHQICPTCDADCAEVDVNLDETKFVCVNHHGWTVWTDGKDV
jgi:hypothetical protein